jgi:hypothetical protein
MLDRTRRVSHYIRLMKLERDFYYKTNLRYVLRVYVTYLIFNCNLYDTNMRRAGVAHLPLQRNLRRDLF